jgi:ATP-dependent Clp protease adapter protein ClpS
MPAEPELAEPRIEERELPQLEEHYDIDDEGPYVVILYNDDYHSMEEVCAQLQKATGYNFERCETIMLEAHTRGRAIAYTGSQCDCERAANILRQIRLQVETDKF